MKPQAFEPYSFFGWWRASAVEPKSMGIDSILGLYDIVDTQILNFCMVALISAEHQSTMAMGALQVAISAALFVDTLLLTVLLQD